MRQPTRDFAGWSVVTASRCCCCTGSWARWTTGRPRSTPWAVSVVRSRSSCRSSIPACRGVGAGAGRLRRRFMEAIELPPAVVCGNSLGGHVALELALSCPGWVERPDPDRLVGPLRANLHPPRAASADRRLRARADGGDLLRPIPGHSRVGRVDPPHRHHAPHRAARAPGGALGQAPQPRGSARPDPRSDSLGVGQGRPHHADRRRRAVPCGASAAHSSCTCPTAGTRRCSSSREAFNAAVGEWLVETRARRAVLGRPLVIERVGGAALRVYAAHRRRALEGVDARRRSRAGGGAARPRQRRARDRVRPLAPVRAGPLRRRLPGPHAPRRLSPLPAALDPRARRRTGPHVARAAPLLGEDVGNHRGRQDDSGDLRGVSRAPEGRLGRPPDRRRARRLRERRRRPAAVPRRLHEPEARPDRAAGSAISRVSWSQDLPPGFRSPLFAGSRPSRRSRTGTSGSTPWPR